MTKKQRKKLIRIIASIVVLAIVWITTSFVQVPEYVKFVLFLIPYVIIGYDVLKKAFKGIIHGQVFDENFLMAIATIGAFALGQYEEGSAVMIFYQIGDLFESLAVGKSRKNIAALMDIRPDYANVMIDGQIEKVDPDEVMPGTVIIVNPGEKVPIDGVVVSGNSTLNTSALTGESVPGEIAKGDEIISGCINLTGRIEIQTTKPFGESTVSKILELVENSSMKKSRSENFITKFAKYYTPIVCIMALMLAILPPVVNIILSNAPGWQTWIIRALTFLVISCPCALVISIPLSFFGGIGCASSNGILIKGSNYLEILSQVKYIVFDKTGTLTKGVFEVTKVMPEGGFTKEQLLFYAAHAESGSTHPISVSLKNSYGREIEEGLVKDLEELAGHGVIATVDGKKIAAGNLRLMNRLGINDAVEQKEGTVVYIAVDGRYAGCIVISDVIKPESESSLKALKAEGIKKNIMLTGDSKEAALAAAQKIGVDEVKYELLPGDKVESVEKVLEEKDEREKLAFVGDGINDAPVLARADIGIAMGGLGSDAAIEAADIVIMDDNLSKISLAMKISRKTLRIVKENIVFALAVKAICLVFGALGIAGMWLAVFADVGVMMLAVINAARALKIK